MKDPIILEGEPFDWEGGVREADRITGGKGMTIRAAMHLDPGVMVCPGCFEYFWKEGIRVRCPDCGHEWEVKNPGPLTARALKRQLEGIEARQPRTLAGKKQAGEELREVRAQLAALEKE